MVISDGYYNTTDETLSTASSAAATEAVAARTAVIAATGAPFIRITPLAKKVAIDLEIDVNSVQGTGFSGKIFTQDLEKIPPVSVQTPTEKQDILVPVVEARVEAELDTEVQSLTELTKVESVTDELVTNESTKADYVDVEPTDSELVSEGEILIAPTDVEYFSQDEVDIAPVIEDIIDTETDTEDHIDIEPSYAELVSDGEILIAPTDVEYFSKDEVAVEPTYPEYVSEYQTAPESAEEEPVATEPAEEEQVLIEPADAELVPDAQITPEPIEEDLPETEETEPYMPEIGSIFRQNPQPDADNLKSKDAMVAAVQTADESVVGVMRMNDSRRHTAEQTLKSSAQTASVTQYMETDVTELLTLQEELNAKKEISAQIPIKAFYLKALAICVKEIERLRLRLAEAEDAYLLVDGTRIGLHFDTSEGISTPTLQDVDNKSLEEIASDINYYTERTKRSIFDEERRSGAITLLDKGDSGVYAFTPIINQPEAAILGIGSIYKKLVMTERSIENRQFITQSLTFDHRIMNGAEADVFQKRFKTIIENPQSLVG